MHVELNLTTLGDRRHFRVAIYMFKCIKGIIYDQNILEMFECLELQHGANTRAKSRNDLIVPPTRTGMGDRAFSVYGAKIWNTLPVDVRKS